MKEIGMNVKQTIANAITCVINDDMPKAKEYLAQAITMKSRQFVNEAKDAGKYYSLLVFEDGKWGVEFGDSERSVVAQEQRDSYKGKKCKIISTSGNQKEINAAVAELNKPTKTD
jgi:hypothetical protein